MFDLDNISVKELFLLQDEALFQKYMRFSQEGDPFFLKPRNNFAKRTASPLGELEFGEVASLKYYLTKLDFKNIYECFDIVFRVKLSTYLAQDVVSYIYALNWIKSEVTKLVERENKTLGGDPDPILEMAGVHRLAKFGELNTLRAIAQQFGKSPGEVEKWKYNLVFSLMLHDKVSGEVQKTYNELKHGSQNKA